MNVFFNKNFNVNSPFYDILIPNFNMIISKNALCFNLNNKV